MLCFSQIYVVFSTVNNIGFPCKQAKYSVSNEPNTRFPHISDIKSQLSRYIRKKRGRVNRLLSTAKSTLFHKCNQHPDLAECRPPFCDIFRIKEGVLLVYFHDVLSGRKAHRDLNVHRVWVEVTLCRADPHSRRGIILKVAHIDIRLTFQPL